MVYQINLSVFEGPFDLLLHLVKINEMEISDIHVAEITDQYLQTIKMMQDFDLDVAGDFLVMAATLIQLKVRALLPDAPEEDDEDSEEISEIMSAKQLMDQLIEYRKFKELSIDLSSRQEEQMRMFYRNSLLPALEQAQDAPPLQAELSLLFDCFSRVLRYVEEQPHHDVAFEPFSVEERVGTLREKVAAGETLEMFALFKQARNKADMIVTFLALLELSRRRLVRLEQGDMYGEVFIFPRPPEDRENTPFADGGTEENTVDDEAVSEQTVEVVADGDAVAGQSVDEMEPALVAESAPETPPDAPAIEENEDETVDTSADISDRAIEDSAPHAEES